MLSYILYRSAGRIDSFKTDCDSILISARERNDRLGLTGFLHAEDAMFVQWLEGPDEALARVVAMINQDPRHRNMTVFGQGQAVTRQFPGWSMGFSTSETAMLFDYLVEQEANSHDLPAYAAILHRFLLQRAA